MHWLMEHKGLLVFVLAVCGPLHPLCVQGDTSSCAPRVMALLSEPSGRKQPFAAFEREVQQTGQTLKSNLYYFDGVDRLKDFAIKGKAGKVSVTRREFHSYINRLEIRLADLKQGPEPKAILDVGAGFSNFIDVANHNFGTRALAIDASYKSIPIEALSPDYQPVFRATRLPMDARKMQFPNDHFDLVVSNTMMLWFFKKAKSKKEIDIGISILEEMIRVTKPGGQIRTTHVPDPATILGNDETIKYYKSRMTLLAKKYERSISIEFPRADGYGYLTKITKK